MNNRRHSEAVVKLLQHDYGCDTVILFGSRARGDEDCWSDYDLLGIQEKQEVIHENRVWKELYLDIFLYSRIEVEHLILQDNVDSLIQSPLIRLEDGIILTQKNSVGTRLMARISEVYRNGPPQTSMEKIQFLKILMTKMLERSQENDVDSQYVRACLLARLLDAYFILRSQWVRGPKRSFDWLRERDPDVYLAFSEALQPSANRATLARLVRAVVEQ